MRWPMNRRVNVFALNLGQGRQNQLDFHLTHIGKWLYHILRIDNADLEHMCTLLCVFSDILGIYYLIWT